MLNKKQKLINVDNFLLNILIAFMIRFITCFIIFRYKMSDIDNNSTKFNKRFNERCKKSNKMFNKFQSILFINNIARII